MLGRTHTKTKNSLSKFGLSLVPPKNSTGSLVVDEPGIDKNSFLLQLRELNRYMEDATFIEKIRKQPWQQMEEFITLRSNFVLVYYIISDGKRSDMDGALNGASKKILEGLEKVQLAMLDFEGDGVPCLNGPLREFLFALSGAIKRA